MGTAREDQDEPIASSTEVHPQKTFDSIEATAEPLLKDNQAVIHIPRWPTAPSNVQKLHAHVVWNTAFDIALFMSASAFLAFAIIVGYYDQAPTAFHPVAAARLQAAIKYVRRSR